MKKILVFLLTIVVLSVCSCRSSKTDTTVHQDNTEQKQTEQEEVSTDKAQVSVNKNVERMIEMMQQMEFNWQKTNYSPRRQRQERLPDRRKKPIMNNFRYKYRKFRKPC